jgi:hypothetical protein
MRIRRIIRMMIIIRNTPLLLSIHSYIVIFTIMSENMDKCHDHQGEWLTVSLSCSPNLPHVACDPRPAAALGWSVLGVSAWYTGSADVSVTELPCDLPDTIETL